MSNLEKHLISVESCKVFAKQYESTNYSEINSKRPSGKPDSKEYTYELDVLKEYIMLIEAEMEKRGVKNKGIKVTMGKYPEDYDAPNFDPKYRGYQTIFFSPVDLDRPSADPAISNEFGKDSLGVDAPGEIPNMDYGQICPPFC
ncbi:hypothetical protein [Chryseobacterium koreense]|uniref:hypothetical protein n=1 Tax=Chryseobacterium koreense TaxID=232216 RepID=UPI0026F03FD5|nr:hypothetical protein [Chryseobacterium koreense]